MPEVEYSHPIAASVDDVWDFVAEMDNWAPFLTGYQRHEKLSDTDSIWFLKGEIGGLTRTVEFRVHVREWNVGERISFDLEGVNDPMNGSGMFTARDCTVSDGLGPEPSMTTQIGVFGRLIRWISRLTMNAVFCSGHQASPQAAVTQSAESEVTFQLSMVVRGATGPLLNMLIAPMLRPVAEDLARQIGGALERH